NHNQQVVKLIKTCKAHCLGMKVSSKAMKPQGHFDLKGVSLSVGGHWLWRICVLVLALVLGVTLAEENEWPNPIVNVAFKVTLTKENECLSPSLNVGVTLVVEKYPSPSFNVGITMAVVDVSLS
ncbi:hypothetical protein PoB_004319500, partial [Plakobranchus ocellatus]